MRKFLIPIAALPLALGACATSPYGSGYGYGADPVTSAVGVLSSVLGSQRAYSSPYGYNSYGYGGGGFSQAAVSACANYASRYGNVQISQVRQTSGDKVHVYGYASNGYSGRNFDCSFRSDGRISDFDI
jgi:hypothetical protein